jgi:hypothetical protein
MSYIFLATLAWSTILCVCPCIDSNEKKTLFLSTISSILIFATIDNSNYIPIGLSVVGHESFEVWIENTIIHHDLV